MSLRKLPEIKALQQPKGYSWDVPSDLLARWSDGGISAAEADDPNTITIYDVIGQDFWTGGGFTAKRMSAALRSIGAKDVTVKINSPGGDVFEGFAIYNQLREHPAKVTVDVMGIAASAASVIAMAGDDVRMGLGTFIMVHNAWGVVVGNRHDLADVAAILQQIDDGMADIYEARTGLARKDIAKLMDGESYLAAKDAVDNGFADSVSTKKADTDRAQATLPADIIAKRRLDALLAQSGVPRSERRRMLVEATGGTHEAASTVTHDAGLTAAGLRQLISSIKT